MLNSLYSAKDVPDKTPATSEHNTPKCHTPKKPAKPRSKKKKLHPKQLVYSETMAGESTGGAIYEKSKKIKKKQLKTTTGPDKNIYEFTEETRPSSSTIKSTIKPKKEDKKKMSKSKRFLSREIEEKGTWVQCSADRCGKWRYLSEVTDPATVPDRWTCSMNTDEEYNSCEKTEADWSELEFVDTCYVEGSLVWAKMPGYPWWPGMVEEDPDDQAYYETDSRQKPIRYHVVFFGKTVSRAWIPERSVQPFTRQDDSDHLGSLVVDGKNYRKRVHTACTMARQAVVLSIKKRLQTFGFGKRFQGHWGKQEVSSEENDKEPLKKTTSKISPEEEAQPTSPDDLSDSGSVEDLMEQAEKVLGNAESFLTSLQNKGEDNDGKSDEEFEYSPGKVMKISHEPPVLKKDKEQSEEPKPVNKRKGKKSDDNQIPKKKRRPFCQKMENKLSNNDKEVTENTDTEMKPKSEDKQAEPVPKPKKPSFKPPRQKKTSTATASPNDTSENKATEPPPECEPPIPFDSEIFTMEMDSQEESCNKQPKTVNKPPTKTTKKAEKKANPDQEAQKNDSDDVPPCSVEASNTDEADDLLSAPNSPYMDLPDTASTESICPSSPEVDLTEKDVDPDTMDSCVPSSPAMDFEEHLDDSNVPGSPLMDFGDDDESCLPVHGTEDPFSDNSQPFDLEE
ncbi:Zinc finger CW-type PWWP domain protein 1 [Branchiostoma belcheri]|nr:Zinc finger CW-type PWWP domain protein 1 [Branchiostoma belcheri]